MQAYTYTYIYVCICIRIMCAYVCVLGDVSLCVTYILSDNYNKYTCIHSHNHSSSTSQIRDRCRSRCRCRRRCTVGGGVQAVTAAHVNLLLSVPKNEHILALTLAHAHSHSHSIQMHASQNLIYRLPSTALEGTTRTLVRVAKYEAKSLRLSLARSPFHTHTHTHTTNYTRVMGARCPLKAKWPPPFLLLSFSFCLACSRFHCLGQPGCCCACCICNFRFSTRLEFPRRTFWIMDFFFNGLQRRTNKLHMSHLFCCNSFNFNCIYHLPFAHSRA